MTLIVGYIHSDSSIHIFADSAETIDSINKEKTDYNHETFNSFGEILHSDNDSITIESAQKIFNFNDTIIITFSGQVYEGDQVLRDLKFEIENYKGNNISNIISDYFLKRKPSLSEYIIGFREDNNPKIYYYRNKGGFLTKNGASILLGSGSQNELLSLPLVYTLEILNKSRTTSDNLSILLISIIQCCAINALTFKSGVGGFFNGAYINSKGVVQWAKDTSCSMYSSKHFEQGERFLINKFNRDNVTYITSPKIEKTAFFPNTFINKISPNEWVQKWSTELDNLNTNCICDYYSFICYDRRIVTLVNRNNDRFEKYLKIKPLNDNIMELIMSELLLKNLLSYSVDPLTNKEFINGFGVQLNYL
ncbi:hypothetical protein [Flavobacterium sp. SM2513]|uniref:hypothetical protein n=1 Tax=Flavobacterium sp. SM2513 TaxID=3424766 RepID=UPI003D7FF775